MSEGKSYINAGQKVVTAIDELFVDGINLTYTGVPQVCGLTGYYWTRARRNYIAVLLLCDKGYGVEAQVLVRTMLEDLIDLRYIATDPENLSVRWAEHEGRYRYNHYRKALEAGENPEPPDDLAELLELAARDAELPKKHRPKNSWTPLQIKERACEADRLGKLKGAEHSYGLYQSLCEHTHGSVVAAKDYLEMVDGVTHLVPEPSGYKRVTSLAIATWLLHWTLKALNSIGLQGELDVMELANQYANFNEPTVDDLNRIVVPEVAGTP